MKMRNVIFQGATLSRVWALVVLVAGMAANCHAENIQLRSKWDEALLDMELHDVHIEENFLLSSFDAIMNKYLLRANLYLAHDDRVQFGFDSEKATGKELLEALVGTYAAYTYTQDRETGVIWVHPKSIKYEDILNQKVAITHPAMQVPAYWGILEPLCNLLSPEVTRYIRVNGAHSYDSSGRENMPSSFCYWVDLQAGVYPARQILNLCCVANPSAVFEIRSQPGRPGSSLTIDMRSSHLMNRFARAGALRFWEIEIGKSPNGTPGLDELRLALCNTDPRKRWAAVESGVSVRHKTFELGNGSVPHNRIFLFFGRFAPRLRHPPSLKLPPSRRALRRTGCGGQGFHG